MCDPAWPMCAMFIISYNVHGNHYGNRGSMVIVVPYNLSES